jgi:hypothetical protein
MTKEEIAADRAVCDAAMWGPWTTKPILGFPDWGKVYAKKGGGPFQLLSINLAALGDVEEFRESHKYGTSEYDRGPELAAATADFIAAARERWPAALDRIEQLENENAALRAQVNGHAERIAAQSELLSRKAEK